MWFRCGFMVILVVLCQADHKFHIKNQCQQTVWVGILGNHLLEKDVDLPQLSPCLITLVDVSGGVPDVTPMGPVTGDCGRKIKCNGAGGQPPATLAEFTLGGYGGQDFYDVSLVDGYNLQMKIFPTSGTFVSGHGTYYCTKAECVRDLNSICPKELQILHGGKVVACQSACTKFQPDNYCCRDAHNTPQTCPPFSFSKVFKQACPKAYSYAYDDQTSTFTCRGQPHTGYTIQFC